MTEIEKLYENCGIEIPIARLKTFKDDNGEIFTRPPFTAEKILKVIIFLLNKQVKLSFSVEESTKISVENFKESIAKSVNYLWQDLTEAEKQQMKGILE